MSLVLKPLNIHQYSVHLDHGLASLEHHFILVNTPMKLQGNEQPYETAGH